MLIQDKIRHTREAHQWTQEEMAEKMNMSASGYAKIERGETHLKFEKLQQIANIFNIDVSELTSSEDRSFIILINESGDHVTANCYSNSKDLASEIEKLKIMLSHKDEIIQTKNELLETKNKEINNLHEIIKLMKKSANI